MLLFRQVSSFGLNLGTEILALLWPPWHSLEEATGEKQGFRVSLSEKKELKGSLKGVRPYVTLPRQEFMQCRGQAWFACPCAILLQDNHLNQGRKMFGFILEMVIPNA